MKVYAVFALALLLLSNAVFASDSDEDSEESEDGEYSYQRKEVEKPARDKDVKETKSKLEVNVAPQKAESVVKHQTEVYEASAPTPKVEVVKEVRKIVSEPVETPQFVIKEEVQIKNQQELPFGVNVKNNEKYHPDRTKRPVFANRAKMIETPQRKLQLVQQAPPTKEYHTEPRYPTPIKGKISVDTEITKEVPVFRQTPKRFHIPRYETRPYFVQRVNPFNAPRPVERMMEPRYHPSVSQPIIQEQSYDFEYEGYAHNRHNDDRFVRPQFLSGINSARDFTFQDFNNRDFQNQGRFENENFLRY